jgi:transposase
LERHRVVDLLEDATAATFATWLQAHPGAEGISRDRGGAFAEGGREGAPDAIQIADRFHLLKNLGDAVEEYLGRIPRQLPPQPQSPATSALSAAVSPSADPAPIPPRLPRHAHERQQQCDQRRNRRLERSNAVIALHQKGMSAQRIARALEVDRKTVYKYRQAEAFPEIASPAKRRSVLAPLRAYLPQRWDAGCHNALELFRELPGRGFPGRKSIVAAAVAPPRQRQSAASAAVIAAAPNQRMSARQVRWALLGSRDELPPPTRDALDTFLAEHAEARRVYELAQRFGQMVRERRLGDLDEWLTEARRGPREMRRLVVGIDRDRAAVEAALTHEWSRGQTEGQINRVKSAKRSMFGRANFDLLRRRVLEAA